MILALTSCTMTGPDSGDIMAPQPGDLNLSRFWKYESAYSLNTREKLMADEYYRNLTAYIDRNTVQIGGDRIKNPSFRVIRVKTYDYFLSRYRAVPEDAGIDSEYTDVYSITDAGGYSSRLFRLSDDRIAVERNNILLFFTKAEETAEETVSETVTEEEEPSGNGVLLGLRGERDLSGAVTGPAPLRTLWIRTDGDGEIRVFEVENILLPRDTFYLLSITREENIDVLVETINLQNLSSGETAREGIPKKLVSRFTDITFISDSYISTSQRLARMKSPGLFQYFSTRNTDRLAQDELSAVGDLFGSEGSEIFRQNAEASVTGFDYASDYLGAIDESAFIIVRQNGHWGYRGRINYPQEYSDQFVEFSMTLKQSPGVFRYDGLTPQWPVIKEEVPEASDAVSSPDGNLTIVKTQDNLQIYRTDSMGNLSPEPQLTIPLRGSETIIMNEWSGKGYVEEWESTVKKLGREIKE